MSAKSKGFVLGLVVGAAASHFLMKSYAGNKA